MADLHTLAAAILIQRTTEVEYFDVVEEYGDALSEHELNEVMHLVETAKVFVKWEDARG